MSLRAIDLFFATSTLGAIFVPANPAFSRAELEVVLRYLQPAFLVVDHAHHEEAIEAAGCCGAKVGVLHVAGRSVAAYDLEAAARRASDSFIEPAASAEDPNVFFLTSGSTGRPKAVSITHRAHCLRTAGSQAYQAVCGGRGLACMFPLFHMAGWYMVLQAIGRLRPIHLTRRASSEALWSILDRHHPEELYCIPAVWRRMLEDGARHDGSSLHYALTGTSRVELDLVEELRRQFPNARNGIYYGSTEMGVSLGIGHDDIFAHPYSVGLPMPGIEARIDDGELLLRAPTAMSGYHELPAETVEVLQDGWYRTGDLVEADHDGFYTIVGRRREIIRSGGETIAPVEVEQALAQVAGVREVAVVGLPDDQWGEVVCAVLVMAEGMGAPSVASLRASLGTGLAACKQPRMVRTWDGLLPRTGATGQVQRSRIRDEIMSAAELET